MLNLRDRIPPTAERRFADDLGSFFAAYGLSHVLGRVFGYLLLRPDPATLDDIAADVGISKSSASTATRLLDGWNLVRRIPEPGSKRIRFEATTSIARVLEAGLAKLQRFAAALQEGRRIAAAGAPADRLEGLSSVYQLYIEATEEGLRRVKEASQL